MVAVTLYVNLLQGGGDGGLEDPGRGEHNGFTEHRISNMGAQEDAFDDDAKSCGSASPAHVSGACSCDTVPLPAPLPKEEDQEEA